MNQEKQGYDPTAPYHPIWNPEPPPEPTFGDYMLAQEREKERKRQQWKINKERFQLRLDTMTLQEFKRMLLDHNKGVVSVALVVEMLRKKTWTSGTAFAAMLLGRPRYWAKPVGKLLEREGLLEVGEFRQCFTDRRGRILPRRK